ncbi:hypothetical protein [Pseudogemmobacter sonorensis]|uniref:hypothetical protein n=1 Tax=Pseudogemmobacter sonorensis TaxID=2989681 RepID=UPI00368D6DC7
MAIITGESWVRVGDKEYHLHLSMRGIAALQEEYGSDLGAFISAPSGGLRDFGPLLRLTEVALRRHHPDATLDEADDILSQNPSAAMDLFNAAFSDLYRGDGEDGGKPKGGQK